MTVSRIALCVFMFTAIISCAVSRQRPVPDAGPDEWSPIGLEGWEVAWVATAGSPATVQLSISELASNVFALDDGSAVIAGQFTCEAVFGEGEENETTLVEKQMGTGDGFVAKYGVDGRLEWARSLGGPGDDTGFDVLGLDDGGIILGGRFMEEAVFSPGEPDEIVIPASGDGAWNAFIARYSQVGELEWVVPFYAADSGHTSSLARGNDQRFYVAGGFIGNIALGKNDEAIILESLGYYDYFIASFTYDGEVVWAKGIGNESGQIVPSMAPLPDGSVVIASKGPHENLKLYSTQVEMEGLGCTLEPECAWVARLDPNGDLLWGTSFEFQPNLDPDVSTTVDGNVVLSTGFNGASDICPQSESAPPDVHDDKVCFACIKLDIENGSTLWTNAFATSGHGMQGMNPRPSSLSGGNIVVTGNFIGDLYVSGLDDPDFPSVGDDFFVSIINPEGTLQGINAMGGTGYDRVWGLDTIGNDTIFMAGIFQSTNYYPTCFGTGYGEDICLPSSGIEDIFLMKLVRSASSPD